MTKRYIAIDLLPIAYLIILSVAVANVQHFMLWYFILFALTYLFYSVFGSIRYYKLLIDIKTRHRKFDDSWLSREKLLTQLDHDTDQDLIARFEYQERLKIHIMLYFIVGIIAGFSYPILFALLLH